MPHNVILDESPAPLSQMARVAAQERVSAPELAAALAAIETRRTADAHFEAGTITVGEAIAQLNLDIAASEVLTEVLAQREQKADDLAARRKKRRRTFFASVFPVTLIGTCLGVGGVLMQRGQGEQAAPPATVQQTEPLHVFRPETLRVTDTNTRTGKVIIRTLAEVPDNHPVSVLSSDLLSQISLPTPQDFVISSSVAPQMAHWTLIKHEGAAYLRGYVGAPLSAAALASGEVVIYNHAKTPSGLAVGPNPCAITFRLSALQGTTDSSFPSRQPNGMVASLEDDWQRVVLPNLSGDKYLWE